MGLLFGILQASKGVEFFVVVFLCLFLGFGIFIKSEFPPVSLFGVLPDLSQFLSFSFLVGILWSEPVLVGLLCLVYMGFFRGR